MRTPGSKTRPAGARGVLVTDAARPLPGGAPPTRPGDVQPLGRLLHIGYGSGGEIPDRYLCGAPVRALIGRSRQGDPPHGGGICPICAFIDRTGA